MASIVPLISAVVGVETNIKLFDKLPIDVTALSPPQLALLVFFLFLVKFFLITLRSYLVYGFEWSLRARWIELLSGFNLSIAFHKFIEKSEGEVTNLIFNETLKSASALRQILELAAQIFTIFFVGLMLLLTSFDFFIGASVLALLVHGN